MTGFYIFIGVCLLVTIILMCIVADIKNRDNQSIEKDDDEFEGDPLPSDYDYKYDEENYD